MQRWLLGYFGQSNLGDDLLMLGALKSLGGDDVIVLSDDPQATRKVSPALRVSLLPPLSSDPAKCSVRYRTHYWLRHGTDLWRGVLGTSYSFYACAGAVNDHVPGRVEDLLDRVQNLKRLATRIAIIGAGVGPIRSETDRAAARKLHAVVDYMSVRDPESAATMSNLGIPNDCFHLGADLSFAFAGEVPQNQSAHQFRRVALNLRPLFDRPLERGKKGEFVGIYRDFADDLIRELILSGYDLTLLPFSPEDEIFLNQFAKRNSCRLLTFDPRPLAMFRQLVEFDLVIGMRLHCIIMALLTGIATVPLPYAWKVVTLTKEIDLYNRNLCFGDGGELPPGIPKTNAIFEEIQKLADQKDSRRARIRKYCLEQRERLSLDISRARHTLGEV